MTITQEIKHDYQCGRITYEEMREGIKEAQASCKHKATTVFLRGGIEEFCDKCGKKMEDES